jgi:FtsP/CotA-like multicopper oxidase with cupredoxin domain
MSDKIWRKLKLCSVVTALVLTSGVALGAEFYLRADTTTVTLPDGDGTRDVPMWGFALDSAFGAGDGQVAVPGPTLTVDPGDNTLTIHLDNNLSVPVSIIIPGQVATMTPTRNPDGRARSFTKETPAGNVDPVTYTWSSLRPGTYLYHSGTHPAVQVQMGLYGALKKDFGTQEVYEGVSYNAELLLLFSEIDPELHDAVASGNYGPGKAVTSTIDYRPQYFLINGKPYTPGLAPLPTGGVGKTTLIRFVNAGLKTHVPLLQGMHMTVVAEDGNAYPFARQHYAVFLPAAKTKDVVINPSAAGTYPIYDRKLHLTSGAPGANHSPGGMLTFIEVAAP